MNTDWTEKYRPRTLDTIIGNPGAANTLRSWANMWENGVPESRCIVLTGPPGIGKTTAAMALAREMAWGIVEMNASEQRRQADVNGVAGMGATHNAFAGDGTYLSSTEKRRSVIVMDEADMFLGNNDRGGSRALNELIRETRQPVIIIVNDYYALTKKNPVAKDLLKVEFRRPQKASIAKALYRIAEAEGVEVEPDAMELIAENAGGDMRAAVRDLQSLAIGRDTVTRENAETLARRETEKDIFAVVNGVLLADTPADARQAVRAGDADPPTKLLWIDENLPSALRDRGDLVRGLERLSRSAIHMGRVGSRMNYGFWSYASDFMSFGLRESRYSEANRIRVNFPQYLTRMGRSKGARGTRGSLEAKAGIALHTAPSRVGSDLLPYLSTMASGDPELLAVMTADMGLEEAEIGMLIGKKAESRDVKNALKRADEIRATRKVEIAERTPFVAPTFDHLPPRPGAVAEPEPKKEEPEVTSPPSGPAPAKKAKGQLSLFDFR